jgi:poly(A) polymerase
MLRAVVMASRLNFRLDPPIVEAIDRHRSLIATSAPARLIEEYYKILRSGAAEQTFRALAEHRLLEPITPEIQRGARNQALWDGLAALDAYRRNFEAAPASLRNPVLLGTLLIPLGLMPKQDRRHDAFRDHGEENGEYGGHGEGGPEPGNELMPRSQSKFRRPPKEPILKIGLLPIARGDTERLRQLLSLQARIADLEMPPRAKRALMHRSPFEDALTWFEIHGQAPAVLEHWKGFIEALGPNAMQQTPAAEAEGTPAGERTGRRRRRRGRRRGRGRGYNRPPEQ